MRPSGAFTKALEITDSGERASFLEEVSKSGSPELAEEVSSLLLALENSDPLLEHSFFVPEEVKRERKKEKFHDFPERFGEYALLEVIGRGGMGVIYKASQDRLERVVALKMIKEANLATRDDIVRFYAEAKAAASLNHPGIVPVYEAGCIGEQHYFTMGLVEGIDLGSAVENCLLTFEQKVFIIENIVTAVSYAHQKGVIHRDLKPENILLSRGTQASDPAKLFFPLITDFGLAKRMGQNLNITLEGQIFGTPGYIAPEQIHGDVQFITESTDIYSIGALIYFILSGSPPYQAASVWETMKLASEADLKGLRTLDPSIPKDLETICHKCLEKEPNKRFLSVEAIADDLKNYRNHIPLNARPCGRLEKFRKLCRRYPTATVTWVLVLVILGLVIAFQAKLSFRAHRHSGDLSAKNLALSQSYLAQERALTASDFERVRSELGSAILLASGENQNRALEGLLRVVELAEKSGQTELEELARYNLGTFYRHLWTRRNLLPVQFAQDFSISSDGNFLAALSRTQGLFIYDISNSEILFNEPNVLNATTVEFHPSEELFAVGCRDGIVRIWKNVNGQFFPDGILQMEVEGENTTQRIEKIGFTRDGKIMCVSSRRQPTQRWDMETRLPIGDEIRYGYPANRTRFSTQSNLGISFTRERGMYGWDMVTGEKSLVQWPPCQWSRSMK